MKTPKVLEIGKKLLALPSRGEIAVQEQMRIFRHALVTAGKSHALRSRGEVALQEQTRIMGQVIHRSFQSGEPKTRGEIAAQEQTRIFRQAAGNLTDAIQAFPTQRETDAIQAFIYSKKESVNYTK